MREGAGTILSFPGVMAHAQQAALALHEAGELRAFVTTLAFHDDDPIVRCLRASGAARLQRELSRRNVSLLPRDKLVRYPCWELLRTLAGRWHASEPRIDRLWNRMSLSFDETVARRHLADVRCAFAFEYTALATFEQARATGVRTVLDVPSLDSLQLKRLLDGQLAQFPEIRPAHHDYFEALFAERYARRQRELALADLVIANSTVTARSHIDAGADPAKVRVVPLGGPPPVAQPTQPDIGGPLKVLWASGFTLRKGAHHFFEAWRRLQPGAAAQAWLYGGVHLPGAVLERLPPGLELRGAVSQAELFAAMRCADVLVFPTLSDGWGMVVSEALAHGLPVITTRSAGAADLIRQGHNGFIVPPGDPESLAASLQWCLDHRQDLRDMRQGAWESAARWQWADYRAALREALARA